MTTAPPPKRTRQDDGDDQDRPAKRPRTRSVTKPQRDQEQAAYEAELARVAAELQERRQQALDNMPQAPAGNRNDGKLHIAFIQVGQGDCTVVTTPAGRVLLFDCGSIGRESEFGFTTRVRSTLRGAKFLRGAQTIDVLILTHPDRDHYNQLGTMLRTDFTIQTCYHSFESSWYSVNRISSWLKKRITNLLHLKQVVHNHDPLHLAPGSVSLNGQAVQPAGDGTTIDRLDGQGGIRIVDEPNCKISILAAGVAKAYTADKSDDKNRGSIVTLIEAFGKKILLCGDATVNTEQYLINTTGNRLQDLTVVQIGHHASKNTSSSRAFVRLVNPWAAVASAAKKVDTFHLPSDTVLVRYQNQLSGSNQAKIAEHETFYWTGDEELGGYTWGSNWSGYRVFTTGSRGTIEFTFEAVQ